MQLFYCLLNKNNSKKLMKIQNKHYDNTYFCKFINTNKEAFDFECWF
jgi:hypothetical protein